MVDVPGGRPGAWVAIAIIGLVGAGAFAVGVTTPAQRTVGLVVGIFMLVLAGFMAVGAGRRAAPGWSVTTVDGRPAWSLRLGGSGSAAAMAAIPGVLGVALAIAAFQVETPVAVALGVIALFLLVLAAEGVRLFRRRPELRVSAEKLRLRGPGVDAELAWDDVGTVEHRDLGTRWAAVAASAVAGAGSYRCEPRRFLLPTDRVPEQPGIVVRVGLVPDPSRLVRVLRAMHSGGHAGREAMIGRGLPEASGH